MDPSAPGGPNNGHALTKGKALSNAMRFGKRSLAAVAAGALGAGLITFVAAPAAQAGVATSVAWDYPSMTIVATGLSSGDNPAALTAPVRMYDAGGDLVASADDTANRAVQITVAAPATADFEDSVVAKISSTTGVNISSGNAAALATTQVNYAGVSDWAGLLGIDGAGTYTFTARLINTTTGAVLSTSTMPVTIVSSAGAPAANVTYRNPQGNTIANIGVDADESIAAQSVRLTNATGGRYVILDDSISFSSATLTLPTPVTGTVSAISATGPGNYTFTPGTLNSTGVGNLTKTLAGTVVSTTATAVIGTGTLTYNVGNVDPAAGSSLVLTTTPSFDPTLTDDTYQVPPGTAKLDFAFNLANGAPTGTVAWNASSNAVGGAITAAGGAAAVSADSGTISIAPNAAASAEGKVIAVTLGAGAQVASRQDTVWVVFTAPGATLIPNPSIGQVATATPIPGTVTTQYGAALPGAWAIRLLAGSVSCAVAATPIATATASATGEFSITIPAANTPTTPGSAVYTVCASNGFASAGTAGNAPVTFTATGGVTSLSVAGVLNQGALATSLPVVQVPGTGIVNVGTLTTVQQTAATTLTAATIASAGTAFRLNATVTPATSVTFSGTEGVLFTTQSAGSLPYTLGSSKKSVATSGTPSGTATVYVFATKPGTHVVTATAGTSTATFSFKAGVARGSIRQITPDPASITLKPNEFKATSVKATDIYGNPVPDDSSITAALAGGGTIAPVAGTTLTTNAAGVVQVFYTAPLGTGTGRMLWTAGTYVSGTIPGAPPAVFQAATEIIVSDSGPGSQSIVIVGERGTVEGKPGIFVEGATEGFNVGTKMVPSIRFPGQSGFTTGSARPTTALTGDFSWQRKTGKKASVRFTNEAGDVRSNTIIIPAN